MRSAGSVPRLGASHPDRPSCARRCVQPRPAAARATRDLVQTALQTERFLERGLRNEQLCALRDDLGGYYNDYISISAGAAEVQTAVSTVTHRAHKSDSMRGSALENAVQVVAVLNMSHALTHEAFTARNVQWEQLRGDSLRERDGSRSVQAERTIRRMAALHGRAKESEEEAAELHQAAEAAWAKMKRTTSAERAAVALVRRWARHGDHENELLRRALRDSGLYMRALADLAQKQRDIASQSRRRAGRKLAREIASELSKLRAEEQELQKAVLLASSKVGPAFRQVVAYREQLRAEWAEELRTWKKTPTRELETFYGTRPLELQRPDQGAVGRVMKQRLSAAQPCDDPDQEGPKGVAPTARSPAGHPYSKAIRSISRTGLAQGVRYDQASTRSLMLVSFHGPELDAQGLELQTQCLVALSTAYNPFVRGLRARAQRMQAGSGYQGVDALAVYEQYAALAEQRGLQGWLESTESIGAARGVLAGFARGGALESAGESDDEDVANSGELIEDRDPKKKRSAAAADAEAEAESEAAVVDAEALEAAEAFEESPEELPEVDENAEPAVAEEAAGALDGAAEGVVEETAQEVEAELLPAEAEPERPQGALGAAIGAFRRAFGAQRGTDRDAVDGEDGVGAFRALLERAAKDALWRSAREQARDNVRIDVELCMRSDPYVPQAAPIFPLMVLEAWATQHIRDVTYHRLRQEWLATFLDQFQTWVATGDLGDLVDSQGQSLLATLKEEYETLAADNEDRDYLFCLGWFVPGDLPVSDAAIERFERDHPDAVRTPHERSRQRYWDHAVKQLEEVEALEKSMPQAPPGTPMRLRRERQELEAEKLGIELQNRWTVAVYDVNGDVIGGRLRSIYWDRARDWREKRSRDKSSKAARRSSEESGMQERVQSAQRESQATLADLLPAALAAEPEGRGKWTEAFREQYARLGSFEVAASAARDIVGASAPGSWAAAEERYARAVFVALERRVPLDVALVGAESGLTSELRVGEEERRKEAEERAQREAADAAAADAAAAEAAAAREAATAKQARDREAEEKKSRREEEKLELLAKKEQVETTAEELAESSSEADPAATRGLNDAEAPDFLDMTGAAEDASGERGAEAGGSGGGAMFGPAGRTKPGGAAPLGTFESSSPWLPAGAAAGPDLASQFSKIKDTKDLIAKASGTSKAGPAIPELQPEPAQLRLFRRLPYRLRRSLTELPPALAALANVQPYRPPDVHIMPRYAVAIDPASKDAEMESLGFDGRGKTSQPLAGMPTWALERALDVPITDAVLFQRALTHRSAVPSPKTSTHNARLVYLGTGVYEVVVRALLLERNPRATPEDLSNAVLNLRSQGFLQQIALHMELDKFVVMDVPKMRTGGHLSTNTLASAMLALLYAIQEDQGAEVAKAWLRARLLSVVDVEDPDWSIVWRPAVSEFCAARSNTPPQVYTAGRKRFYALPASPFELATEIVYLLEDGMKVSVAESTDARIAETLASKQYVQRVSGLAKIGQTRDLIGRETQAFERGPLARSRRHVPLVRELLTARTPLGYVVRTTWEENAARR